MKKHYFDWCQLPLKVALEGPPRIGRVIVFVLLSLIFVFWHHLEKHGEHVKNMTCLVQLAFKIASGTLFHHFWDPVGT